MGVKKEKPVAMSLVKGPFIASLQNLMDQGNLLVAFLDAAEGRGLVDGRLDDMLKERTKAFREALYGAED